jgi:hypothetical protein
MNAHLRNIHHKTFDAMFPANMRMSVFRVCGNSLLQCNPYKYIITRHRSVTLALHIPSPNSRNLFIALNLWPSPHNDTAQLNYIQPPTATTARYQKSPKRALPPPTHPLSTHPTHPPPSFTLAIHSYITPFFDIKSISFF